MAVPRIIGLAGPMGTGKSPTAHAISGRWGHEVHHFAGYLKDVAQDLYGVDLEPLRRVKQRLQSGDTPTPAELADAKAARVALLEISALLKSRDEQCFVRPVMRFADARMHGREGVWGLHKIHGDLYGPSLVIDDVRFPYEVNAIQDRGGVVIRLDGPSIWPESERVEAGEVELRGMDLVALDVSSAAHHAKRFPGKRGQELFRLEVTDLLCRLFGEPVDERPFGLLTGAEGPVDATDDELDELEADESELDVEEAA